MHQQRRERYILVTKRAKIISYIETLPVGEKISVRTIAKEQSVSEGTAYRAIKDAEEEGLVSTIYRVGTIRIEKKVKTHIEDLTFEEVLNIIEGELIAGKEGIHKDLKRFVIGAMTMEGIQRYLSKGAVVIVGDREKVQKMALEKGSAILITGGFSPNQEIIKIANEKKLPIMKTTYDSFTVATMINRAMTDQLIKKEILTIEDIYKETSQTEFLTVDDLVSDYYRLNEKSKHSRFPVVNKIGRLVGIITAKDTVGKPETATIERVMTKDVISVKKHNSVASVAHMMIWDGLEIMPIIEDDLMLSGIVTRQDVMKAMQSAQRQPQVMDTIDDQINRLIDIQEVATENDIEEEKEKQQVYTFPVAPQMLNNVGTVSFGVLSQIISEVNYRVLASYKKRNPQIEQMDLHYFKLIQMGSEVQLKPRIFEFGRRSARMDIEVYVDNILMAKAFLVTQLIEQA